MGGLRQTSKTSLTPNYRRVEKINQTHRSTAELADLCAHFLADPESGCGSACQALVNRACSAQNDRAWDALVILLRPYLLKEIFEARPELSPLEAETLLYSVLRRMHVNIGHSAPYVSVSLQSILEIFRQMLD